MPLSPNRPFAELKVNGREVPFSFWPVKRMTARSTLQSIIFSTDAWSLIDNCIRQACPPASKDEEIGLLGQAKDYYSAATSSITSAGKPVLIYYCYLNLVKAFLLHRGKRPTYGSQAKHGLSEQLGAGGVELTDAFLRAFQSSAASINIFDEFLQEIAGTGLAASTDFPLPKIIPQIVPGHRIWASASREAERFIAVDRIIFAQRGTPKQLWTNIFIGRGDLGRLYTTQNEVLARGGLAGPWRKVEAPAALSLSHVLFEEVTPVSYGQHPTQVIAQVASTVKQKLWTTVLSVPPYRKHYVYLCPIADNAARLPQMLSMYALMYYLGSITRYRPHHFDRLSGSPYGGFILSCLADQPTQFLYLLASEFAKQEVTKPAIV